MCGRSDSSGGIDDHAPDWGVDFRKGKENRAWDASQMGVSCNPNNEDIVNTSNLNLRTSIKCYCGDTSAAVHNCAHIIGCYYCFGVMFCLFVCLYGLLFICLRWFSYIYWSYRTLEFQSVRVFCKS
jgi:hypothetical protein